MGFECTWSRAVGFSAAIWWVLTGINGIYWTGNPKKENGFWLELHAISQGCLLMLLAALGIFCEVHFSTRNLVEWRCPEVVQIAFAALYACVGGLQITERSNAEKTVGQILWVASCALVLGRLVLLIRIRCIVAQLPPALPEDGTTSLTRSSSMRSGSSMQVQRGPANTSRSSSAREPVDTVQWNTDAFRGFSDSQLEKGSSSTTENASNPFGGGSGKDALASDSFSGRSGSDSFADNTSKPKGLAPEVKMWDPSQD